MALALVAACFHAGCATDPDLESRPRATFDSVLARRPADDGARSPAPATFHVVPTKPIQELRCLAEAEQPPSEDPSLKSADFVEIRDAIPDARYDIRYATSDNFLGTPLYGSPHAWLDSGACTDLESAARRLRGAGFGIIVHDAYRPWFVTRLMWDATPPEFHDYVADPAAGSRHNRGCAVDIELCDPTTGAPEPMPSGYDEFSPRAHPDHAGGTPLERWHRDLLRAAMEDAHFTVNEHEWWHFDHDGWKDHAICNLPLEGIGRDQR